MSKIIPLSVPNICGNEWNYVKECLDTGWVSSAGKYVDLFEKKISEYTGAKHTIACVNGTSALHISLIISGVKSGDEVLVPTLTFIAPINAVRYVNANPVFFDCDEFYNIDPNKVSEFLIKHTVYKSGSTYNKKTNRKITAIIPVHIFGNAVNIEPLIEICAERNIKIIEDATESLGTFYNTGNLKGKHTGTVGLAGCLSFNGNKIMTTGGGGMIYTNDDEFAQKAKYLTTQAKDDEVEYIHNEIGYNYRMNNIQAAVGIAQLESFQSFLKIKKENYHFYKEEIDRIKGLHIAEVPEYADNNYWMYGLQIDMDQYPFSREELMRKLNEVGIQTRPVWFLNHLQKYLCDFENYDIDNAIKFRDMTLNIPCSTNLKKTEIEEVIKLLM